MQYLDSVSKMPEWSVCFHGKPFSITEIQVYALTTNAEETEAEQFCEDLQDLLELTPKKDVLFIIGERNAKVGSQEIPGFNRQVWLWSTKWSRAKANRALPRERTGHSKHPLPTTQKKTLHMDITRWSTLSVMTFTRWCPCVESSLVLLAEGVCYDQCVLFAKLC